MPSRLSTARPPWRPISTASRGPTTPSMAAAMIGSSKRWPQSSQEMSTSFGLTVTVPGTSAMSSNPYATLALRPRPTHIPIGHPPVGSFTGFGPDPVYRDVPATDLLDFVDYTGRDRGCQRCGSRVWGAHDLTAP